MILLSDMGFVFLSFDPLGGGSLVSDPIGDAAQERI
jgi:hypothetical protein